MFDGAFSFDFLGLCDEGWVMRQMRSWVRFSDNGDLRDYLKTMNRIAPADRWFRGKDWGGPSGNYWDFALSLIPREIGGNSYLDNHGDANFGLPELPPQKTGPWDEEGRTLFRDTLKALCIGGQDAPDSHLVSTNFDRS